MSKRFQKAGTHVGDTESHWLVQFRDHQTAKLVRDKLNEVSEESSISEGEKIAIIIDHLIYLEEDRKDLEYLIIDRDSLESLKKYLSPTHEIALLDHYKNEGPTRYMGLMVAVLEGVTERTIKVK